MRDFLKLLLVGVLLALLGGCASEIQVQAGDTIILGTYPQEADGTEQPIEWIVLDVKDGKTLVISKYALDARAYVDLGSLTLFTSSAPRDEATWENCSLRGWLNNEFLNAAFSSSERKKIVTTTVINHDNPDAGIPGGNDTRDKVFLLSVEEATQYFDELVSPLGDVRRCKATAYAKSKGVHHYDWENDGYRTEADRKFDGNCSWWLRSPGSFDNYYVPCVNYGGGISAEGTLCDIGYYGVRPALWLKNINSLPDESILLSGYPSTTSSAELKEALDAYKAFVEEEYHEDEWSYSIISFGLYDLNRDGIPELFTRGGGSMDYSKIFTYADGEVEYVHWGSSFQVYDNGVVYADSSGGFGYILYSYYTMSDDLSLELAFRFAEWSSLEGTTYSIGEQAYDENSERVPYQQITDQMEKVIGDAQIASITYHDNTAPERERELRLRSGQ